jgi:hypothetical protein
MFEKSIALFPWQMPVPFSLVLVELYKTKQKARSFLVFEFRRFSRFHFTICILLVSINITTFGNGGRNMFSSPMVFCTSPLVAPLPPPPPISSKMFCRRLTSSLLKSLTPSIRHSRPSIYASHKSFSATSASFKILSLNTVQMPKGSEKKVTNI